MTGNPWRQATDAQLDEERELPGVIQLKPDYGAELPLWGKGVGNIPWELTRFSPELLDRLAAWQAEFGRCFHWKRGWTSKQVRDRWIREADALAAQVRLELGGRAKLQVDLWPCRRK